MADFLFEFGKLVQEHLLQLKEWLYVETRCRAECYKKKKNLLIQAGAIEPL